MKELSVDTMFGHAKEMLEGEGRRGRRPEAGHLSRPPTIARIPADA